MYRIAIYNFNHRQWRTRGILYNTLEEGKRHLGYLTRYSPEDHFRLIDLDGNVIAVGNILVACEQLDARIKGLKLLEKWREPWNH